VPHWRRDLWQSRRDSAVGASHRHRLAPGVTGAGRRRGIAPLAKRPPPRGRCHSAAGPSPHRRHAHRHDRCTSTVGASPHRRCALRDGRCDSTEGASPHRRHARREPVAANSGVCPTGDAPSTTFGATAPRGRRPNGDTPSAKPVGADPGVSHSGEARSPDRCNRPAGPSLEWRQARLGPGRPRFPVCFTGDVPSTTTGAQRRGGVAPVK